MASMTDPYFAGFGVAGAYLALKEIIILVILGCLAILGMLFWELPKGKKKEELKEGEE